VHFFCKLIMKIILFFIVMLLSGCTAVSTATKLGINELEWKNYSPEKKKLLLSNYEDFTNERNKFLKNKKNDLSDDSFLEVSIHDGKIMIPPFDNGLQSYESVDFTILENQCKSVELRQAIDKETYTELDVCLHGNTLYLDPSHHDITKKLGSISINSSPFWLSGFSYKGITSGGYVRLNNVTIEITRKEKE